MNADINQLIMDHEAMHTPTRLRPVQNFYSPSSGSDSIISPDLSTSFNSPSPSSSRISPPSSSSSSKRGRPKSETLTNLITEGKDSQSNIKCKYCSRVFPRDKSLNAHERIHLGLRPYICDYPGCTRAFTQSGQLKTHQRLHTGEKPFKCSEPTCSQRFTHANRHCNAHPYSTLIRCEDSMLDQAYITEQNIEVLKWLEKYRADRDDRTPKRKKLNNDENASETPSNYISPVTVSSITNPKSRKGLMCELDMNAGLGSPTSSKTSNNQTTPKVIKWHSDDTEDELEPVGLSPINPKKRWLRDAWQEDLARPLIDANTSSMAVSPNYVLEANQNRPSVLMIAKKDQVAPINMNGEQSN